MVDFIKTAHEFFIVKGKPQKLIIAIRTLGALLMVICLISQHLYIDGINVEKYLPMWDKVISTNFQRYSNVIIFAQVFSIVVVAIFRRIFLLCTKGKNELKVLAICSTIEDTFNLFISCNFLLLTTVLFAKCFGIQTTDGNVCIVFSVIYLLYQFCKWSYQKNEIYYITQERKLQQKSETP